MRWSSALATLFFALSFLFLPPASAQGNTDCVGDALDWYTNAVGETPCMTYQRLRQICNSEYQVPVFRTTTPGDNCDDQVSSCCCNSIAWALSMLCMNCQQDENGGDVNGIDAGVPAYYMYRFSGGGGYCGDGTNQSLPTGIQAAVCNEGIKIDDFLYELFWNTGAWYYTYSRETAQTEQAADNNDTFSHCGNVAVTTHTSTLTSTPTSTPAASPTTTKAPPPTTSAPPPTTSPPAPGTTPHPSAQTDTPAQSTAPTTAQTTDSDPSGGTQGTNRSPAATNAQSTAATHASADVSTGTGVGGHSAASSGGTGTGTGTTPSSGSQISSPAGPGQVTQTIGVDISNSSKKSDVAAIAGGAAGGVGLVVVTVLVVLLCYRRRRAGARALAASGSGPELLLPDADDADADAHAGASASANANAGMRNRLTRLSGASSSDFLQTLPSSDMRESTAPGRTDKSAIMSLLSTPFDSSSVEDFQPAGAGRAGGLAAAAWGDAREETGSTAGAEESTWREEDAGRLWAPGRRRGSVGLPPAYRSSWDGSDVA